MNPLRKNLCFGFDNRSPLFIVMALLISGIAVFLWPHQTISAQDKVPLRSEAEKRYKEGNYKEAYDLYSRLGLQAEANGRHIEQDLNYAVQCLNSLNRQKEIDALLEKTARVHAGNWRGMLAVAAQYQSIDHYGFIISGAYERGQHRGGNAKLVNSLERDRARALQLAVAAMSLADKETGKKDAAGFYYRFSQLIQFQRSHNESWRLQYLTPLAELPDYDEGYYYGYRGYGGQAHGAPVDAKGNPIYYSIPESWGTARNDGERWRWCMARAAVLDPGMSGSIKDQFARFLLSQFGVQTMAQYSWFHGQPESLDGKDAEKRKGGILSMHTLGENEALARLADGIKRWELPDEFNYIRMFRELQNHSQLADIYRNRRQYPKAAEQLRAWLEKGQSGNAQEQLEQIVKPWGQFEHHGKAPARRGAKVDLRFRNGSRINFSARTIDLDGMLLDIKRHLQARPNHIDSQRVNINQLAHDILTNDKHRQFVGPRVAQWSLALAPLADHFDRIVEVATPMQEAGAYLLTADMEGGNTFHTIIWIEDTVLVKKKLNQQDYYYICDAVSGQPVSRAKVEIIAYRRVHKSNDRYDTEVKVSRLTADKDGQIFVTKKYVPQGFRHIVIARSEKGRMGFYGFAYSHFNNRKESRYNQTKAYVITDRPVYRPEQTVKWKAWIRHARYDQEDHSQFAGQTFRVTIADPQGTKVWEGNLSADEYGGFDAEYSLPGDAGLGVYRINIHGRGGGSFRVEEYKKPEYEVTVETPDKPVMLGDVIEARIEARYYFGEKVKNAKVKYKVLRSSHNARWYPAMYWDWFYEPGYWWFGQDYPWYPGWHRWGCRAPMPWWHNNRATPPELVLENEVEIGEDGSVVIQIDTRIAREVHGDLDHQYTITAEVTDQSRRTVVGSGRVLAAREPFKVYAWVDRGHYQVGDDVRADFNAQTLDNKPVQGRGELILYRISYDKDYQPVESRVQRWKLDTGQDGRARQQLHASETGQYRLSYTVTDGEGHRQEGGYLFVVRGEGFDGSRFRFNDIEIVPDKKEYHNGDTANLLINTNRTDSVVLLFERPFDGVYRKPKVLRLKAKSHMEGMQISRKDMPNFFVEAVTVSDGRVHTQVRELHVPPEQRVLNLTAASDKEAYKPREKAKVKLTLTDMAGKPFVGSTVVTVYDKALEYISGGSNVPEIRSFFWKWRRHHYPGHENSLMMAFGNLVKDRDARMKMLGVFGRSIQVEKDATLGSGKSHPGVPRKRKMAMQMAAEGAMPAPVAAMADKAESIEEEKSVDGEPAAAGGETATPMVRSNFADSVFWNAAVTTDENGMAEISFDMPDNLTGWKIRSWAMGHGTRVGQAETEVVTRKNMILRMQAPRFFVEKDEVVLSANVHNYLETDEQVTVEMMLFGLALKPMDAGDHTVNRKSDGHDSSVLLSRNITVPSGGEKRVDFRVKVVREGRAVIRMNALARGESDAVEMTFPVYVHGMEKQLPFSGRMRSDQGSAEITLHVPQARREENSRLEIRYSPTLAMAMVDALPYMVSYPYGCTEQTLNRFLPTVLTHKILQDMDIDLAAIQQKQSNLNAQEIGDDKARAEQWKNAGRWNMDADGHWMPNPVFDAAVVSDMVTAGVQKLQAMQVSDGGWGWFSGHGEHSYPHTTAYVVHGLQTALQNDADVPLGVIGRGVDWLLRYQQKQVRRLQNWHENDKKRVEPWKRYADNLDAFVFMVLTDANEKNDAMQAFLYRDRNHLAVYAKSMFGIALQKLGKTEKRDMIIRNIEQFLVTDPENQTAYLNLANGSYWWYWYGSEYEAHAYYLKLLVAANPESEVAPWLVKYLLNNRKHATYWKSTRDTAVVIEAFADYIRATGEDKPDMTVEVLVDGKVAKEVTINAENLFTYDNRYVLTGEAVRTGEHKITFRKTGRGPLYFNAYLNYFSLEDFITREGLEIKVDRKVYKLVPVEKKIQAAGSRGQAVEQAVEKYHREVLKNNSILQSGDRVEVELTIESKNDYEYLIFEDMKAAGFEAENVRSGWYSDGGMSAYMELRDEKVAFFVHHLPRGRHSISYRLRAEIPGKFSALPARGYAMYAPELRGNSDEIKLRVRD